jgi:WD40 repeat protein
MKIIINLNDCIFQGVRSVAVTPDGNKIISWSADKTVRVWETETGAPLHVLEGHTSVSKYIIPIYYTVNGITSTTYYELIVYPTFYYDTSYQEIVVRSNYFSEYPIALEQYGYYEVKSSNLTYNANNGFIFDSNTGLISFGSNIIVGKYNFEFVYTSVNDPSINVGAVQVQLKEGITFRKMRLKILLQETFNLLYVLFFKKLR